MAGSGEKIRVLLVDDSYLVRQSVKAMLDFEPDAFEVVGEAENGLQAVDLNMKLKPDVVIMDINMPEMDGIAATVKIMEARPTGVVIISIQGEQEYLRRAMKAGARDYLVKPFTYEELVAAIQAAAALGPNPLAVAPAPAPSKKGGQVITLFSSKGGVGKTTLAANLAAGLAHTASGRVVALDLDLEFGSLASLMGVRPEATLIDLCRLDVRITSDHVNRVLASSHQSRAQVLAAPPLPYLASEVDGDGRADRDRSYVVEIIEALRASADYVIIDTGRSFREATLIALDKADQTLMVTTPEVPTLELTAKGLDVLLERLDYPREKLQIVLNRSDSLVGLTHADIATSLGLPLTYMIPSEGKLVITAANTGSPILARRQKNSPIAEALQQLVDSLANKPEASAQVQPAVPAKPALKQAAGSNVRRLFGLL